VSKAGYLPLCAGPLSSAWSGWKSSAHGHGQNWTIFRNKRENENFPCTSRVVSLAVDVGARPQLGVISLNRPLCASFNLSDLSVRWGQTRQHSNSRSVDFRKPFAAATRFTKMHARTACSPRGGEFRNGTRPSNALATAIFERSPAHCGTSRIVFFGPGSTRAF